MTMERRADVGCWKQLKPSPCKAFLSLMICFLLPLLLLLLRLFLDAVRFS
jgi:hypothetical protein